jgi:hypothetical protein
MAEFDGQQFDATMARFDEMKISDREAQIIVGYLCAAAPAALQRALDHVELLRDPEPRHQPGYADLPFDEQARRQARWLTARGNDVCPVCLGFRRNGVCPGGHDQAAPDFGSNPSGGDAR